MPKYSPNGFFSARPYLVSLILVLLLALWLGMGSTNAQEENTSTSEESVPLAKVAFETFVSQPTFRSIDLYGRTAPDKQARLGAEFSGKIIDLKVSKGEFVKKGQHIAQIDKGDLNIQLERAQAMLQVKQKEFKAAESLKSRGLQGEVAYATAQAALAEAKAGVSNAKLSLRNTVVRAPFEGYVDHLFIELGDYVGIGDPVATVIDLSKLVIEADVSERHIQYIANGQEATVRFINDQTVTGKVRYMSRISSESTNTFPIEIEVANPERKIPAGISTEVTLDLQEQMAVKVTPAMLALDEEGNLGVKTLQDDLVEFIPIQLVKAEQDGVWLSGLGDQVSIITVGQGFVRHGDKVVAVEQDRTSQQLNN